MQEVILFYNGLDVPTRQILDSRGAIPSKTAADAKVAIQEMAEYSQKWHNGTSRTRSTETSDGLAAIQAQLNNLGREIKKVNEKVYVAQVGCEQCKGPHYNKDCPLKEEGKTLEEAYYTQFGAPFQRGGYRATASGFYQRNNANPSKEKDLGSFTLPCFINNVCFNNALADLGASLSVMPLLTYLNLGSGELAHIKLTVELADRIVKYLKGIAENVLVGEVVEEFRARNDARMVSKIFGYPSDCDHDKKIHIDCAYNLKFSCMIDFAILEDMDGYRDEGMGNVIFGEPFLREVGIKARRFEGMITIYNGNESVTYQMV
ncbi:hypothetical protein Tco_0616217 [Tanacetum coccineum]